MSAAHVASRNPQHSQNITIHRVPTSETPFTDYVGEQIFKLPLGNSSNQKSNRTTSKQNITTSLRPATQGNYDKYARTKGKQRGVKSKSSLTWSPRKENTENRDPEAIRRLSSKYFSSDTPVAPPTTPVSRFESTPVELESPAMGEPGRSTEHSVDFVPERSESRQSKYHEECTPKIDPSNVIGSRARREKLDSARPNQHKRRRPSSLASTSSSLLSHRESVVNVVYSGIEYGGDEAGNHLLPLPSLTRRASSVFGGKMAVLTPHPDDVTHGEYDVIEADDYSCCASSRDRLSQSVNPHRLSYRHGFLYQLVEFDTLSNAVPTFVRHNFQKNGRLVTESFILKVNYLRRRRAIGLDNNNNNGNNNVGNKKGQKVSSPGRGDNEHI